MTREQAEARIGWMHGLMLLAAAEAQEWHREAFWVKNRQNRAMFWAKEIRDLRIRYIHPWTRLQ